LNSSLICTQSNYEDITSKTIREMTVGGA